MEIEMSSLAENLKTEQSHDEYFALEKTLEQKYEYIAGEIFAMTGGSINHSLIGKNVTTALDNALIHKPCTVFNSDAKLRIDHVDGFYYPDAMVLCEKGQIEDKFVKQPQIIIEVLSSSTANYDHGQKFSYYRQIETLQVYLMLHQDKPLAEVYQRCDDNSWLFTEYTGLDAVINLKSDLQLAMADLYRQLNFNNANEAQ